MFDFHFPVLAVEPDFLEVYTDDEEFAAGSHEKVIFFVDSGANYYSADGQPLNSHWPQLVAIVKHHVSVAGYCCTAKLQLQNEAQVFSLLQQLED